MSPKQRAKKSIGIARNSKSVMIKVPLLLRILPHPGFIAYQIDYGGFSNVSYSYLEFIKSLW